MNKITNQVELLALKGRKDNLGISIYQISFLLKYVKYKVYEKKINRLLRSKCKNSTEIAVVKTYEKYLNDFKNINTSDDILNAKQLLKEIYFSEDLDTALKVSILDTLHQYIEENDEEFYRQCFKNIFLYHDIQTILNIISFVEDALYYIQKWKVSEDKKDLFWLKELEDKSIVVMQGRFSFFNKSSSSSILRFIQEPLIDDLGLLSRYQYSFPLLLNHDDDIQTVITIPNNEVAIINLSFILEDKEILTLKSLPLVNLIQTFFQIFTTYDNRFHDNKSYKYSIVDDIIKTQIESLNFKYLKRDSDYYLTFNNLKEYRFDVGETFSMFSKIFLFLTLYFKKSKNICLNKLTSLSNKDFFFITDLHS